MASAPTTPPSRSATPDGGGTTASVGGCGARDAVDDGRGRPSRQPLAGRVRERDHLAVRGAESGRLEAVRRVHEGADAVRARVRLGLRRCLVPVLDRRSRRRRRESRPTGIDRPQPCGIGGRANEAVEGVVIGLVAHRLRDTAVERDAQVDALGRIGDVLVDEAGGEPGERIRAARNGHLGLGAGIDAGKDALADIEHLVAHPVTPTRTPRNRHGTDGCPVWPIWPG